MSAIYSPMEKRCRLEYYLDGGLVGISVNPKVAGVDLPEYLMKENKVDLNLSYGFRLPIFDITYDGVKAKLSFNNKQYLCIMPWNSIFYMRASHEEEEELPSEKYLLDLLCMPKDLQAETLRQLGWDEAGLEELAWDYELSDEELLGDPLDEEEDSSDDDDCIDFSAFLAKKKAEEESK